MAERTKGLSLILSFSPQACLGELASQRVCSQRMRMEKGRLNYPQRCF